MRSKSILVVAMVVLVTRNLQADLSDGLVGYWPFNGNANDESYLGKCLAASSFHNHSCQLHRTVNPHLFHNVAAVKIDCLRAKI